MTAPSPNHPTPRFRARRSSQSGVAMVILSLLLFTVLIPMVALAIDGGILYLVQERLSAACDAAALAGARNLSVGNDAPTQAANAETAMTSYFNANFPSGTWNTNNPQLTLNVNNSGTYTRTTSINATVSAPLYFMRVLGKNFSPVAAYAQSTRQDVNVMLVLDRSNSMGVELSNVCTQMGSDARSFVAQFANGRDTIGLVTFMTGSNVDYAPTINFKTASPSLDTTLSTIACGGNTGSAQALWQAYQQIQAINEPTALNVIVFFTDGQPNGLTFDFLGSNPSAHLPIMTSGDTGRYGDYTGAYPSTNKTYTYAPSYCSPGTATTGAIAQAQAEPAPSLGISTGMVSATTPAINNSAESLAAGTVNCFFTNPTKAVPYKTPAQGGPGGDVFLASREDVAYLPAQDHFGDSTNGYLGTPYLYTTGNYIGQIRVDQPISISTASQNAADNAATTIRNDSTYNITIFTVGLGGTVPNAPIDQTFLERVANDPRSPIYSTTQKTGQFVYASDITQLGAAFQAVSSSILRLSQ